MIQAGGLKILIAENVDHLGDVLETVLSDNNRNQIFVARNTDHALFVYELHKHDLIVIDLDIKTEGGIALSQSIRKSNARVPIILMASHANEKAIDEARRAGITDLLVKPFSFDDLMKHINYVLSVAREGRGI